MEWFNLGTNGANMEGVMFDDKMGTAVAMNAIGDRLITGAPSI